MTPEFQKAEELFDRAFLFKPEERAAFLAGACGNDVNLRRRVEDLLMASSSCNGFLPEPQNVDTSTLRLDEIKLTEDKGTIVDRYKLLEKLGEGGFGTVWAAEQREPIRRRVALKIIKLGMDTKQVVARFEAERQALALMDHPNIAKVLDAGATATGRPYFVMELVKGTPITKYCTLERLPTKARLDLFIKVCHAIQHAHQKGIIHRDIKPSNIMVTLHDGVPVPKVIDFGIAKATQQELTEKTIYTQYSQFIGTPAYMSPEQVELNGLDIDTRSDIYSLGVLLYQLLTGSTPFDTKELLQSGLDEMRRIIRESKPTRPSTRVSQTLVRDDRQQTRSSTPGAAENLASSRRLHHDLKGDLDLIVMKCLEKERVRRYESANGLAMDIQRYLNHEPVVARPPSKLYEFQKTVRRHKYGFAAAAALMIVLTVGIVLSTWQAIIAMRARQAADAAQSAELAQKLLAQANEERARESASEALRQAQRAEKQRILAESATRNYRRQVYQSDMNLVAQAYAAGNITRLDELLEKHWPDPWETDDWRGFEWYHWWQAAHLHVAQDPLGGPLGGLAISPDHRFFAVAGYPGQVRIRSSIDNQDVIPAIKMGPSSMAFSPDGRSLILGDSEGLSIFDTTTWTRQDLPASGVGNIHTLAFSPTRPLMASAGDGESIVFWNTQAWEPVGQSLPSDGFVRSLAFTTNGERLIAAMDDSRILVWDLAKQSVEQTLTEHMKSVRSVVHSPVAGLFATGGSDETVMLWNEDLQLIGVYDAFAPVTLLQFSPDGQKLMVGTSANNSLLVWNVEQQPPSLDLAHVIKGHSRAVTGAAFWKEPNTVMSISDDGSRKLWNLSRCTPWVKLGKLKMRTANWAFPNQLTCTPDGNGLWITDPDGKLYWSRIDSPGIGEPPDPQGFRTLAVTSDGAWRAGATVQGHLGVWDSRRRMILGQHTTLASAADFVVVSSGGPTVAWKNQDDVHIWNLKNNTTRALGISASGLPRLSPNGDRVAVHQWDATMVWDITVDPPLLLWRAQGWGPEFCSMFSPGGDLVAVASWKQQIRLHDAETGDLITTLKGHTAAVRSLDFSSDGKRIVSGGEDRTVRIWDVETGQLLSTFLNYFGQISSVVFPSTEDSIISLTDDGTVTVLTASSNQEVYQSVEHWIRRANTYSKQRQWGKALALLDEGLKYNPVSQKLLLARSEAYQRQGDLSAAITDVNQAITLAPKDGTLFRRKADLLLLTSQRPTAIANYVQAITLTAELRSYGTLKQIRDSLSVGSALVPMSAEWRYTTTDPGENWQDPDHFDDSQWQLGRAPFGSTNRDDDRDPNMLRVRSGLDIWLRHTFEVKESHEAGLVVQGDADADIRIYVNKVPAAEAAGEGARQKILLGSEDACLRPGRNVLAVYARARKKSAQVHVGLNYQIDERGFAEVLSKSLEKLPSDLQLCKAVGEFYASQHRWAEAASYFRQVLALNPEDEEDWMKTAALLAVSGQRDDYHRLCNEMLERFRATQAQEIAERIAKVSLYLPPAATNLETAVALAHKSMADANYWNMPYAMISRALADYRSGDFAGARNWAQQALKSAPMWFVDVEAHLVLAMSEFQLNETEAARSSLNRAKNGLSAQARSYRIGTLGVNWHDWLYSQAMLREAATLIDGESLENPGSRSR